MRTLLVIPFILFTVYLKAQTSDFTVNLKVQWGGEAFALDSIYKINQDYSFKPSLLKFYLSDLCFTQKILIYCEEKSYHLVNLDDIETQSFTTTLPINFDFDSVHLRLGIDSTVNYAGAMGADLDPTKEMYWTWQSGYVNFKLEGDILSSNKAQALTYHLGGFDSATRCDQFLGFPIVSKNELNIVLDLEAFFASINYVKINHLMSPNIEAVVLMKSLKEAFFLEL